MSENEKKGSFADPTEIDKKEPTANKGEKPSDAQKNLFDYMEQIKQSIDGLAHHTCRMADSVESLAELPDRILELLEKLGTGASASPTKTSTPKPTPTPVAEPTPAPVSGDLTRKVVNLFPPDLANLLNIVDEGETIVLRPKQYLGSENFGKIAATLRDNGGEYVSQGRESHFKIAKEVLK